MVGKEHPEGKLKKWLLAPRNREIILAIAVVAVLCRARPRRPSNAQNQADYSSRR